MAQFAVKAARTASAGGGPRGRCSAQSRSTRQLQRPPPTDMDYLISLLLVLPCAHASAYQSAPGHGRRASSHQNASPLRFASVYPSAASYLRLASVYPSAASHLGFGRLVQLRGNTYQVYASHSSSEEYEPYAVAALPLHPPVPILQVVSPAASRTKPRRPAKRPRPEPADMFDMPQDEQAYESAEDASSEEESQPKNSKARDQDKDGAESLVVMYARPNRQGGFSYRKPPTPARATTTTTTSTTTAAPAPAPARANQPQEPVIIRIHRYRVIH